MGASVVGRPVYTGEAAMQTMNRITHTHQGGEMNVKGKDPRTTCVECQEIKFPECFRWHKNRGYITTCMKCETKRRKEYYKRTGK